MADHKCIGKGGAKSGVYCITCGSKMEFDSKLGTFVKVNK